MALPWLPTSASPIAAVLVMGGVGAKIFLVAAVSHALRRNNFSGDSLDSSAPGGPAEKNACCSRRHDVCFE